MPESTSDVRSGDPALKYGPSVSAGVGWPEHLADAPGTGALGATDAVDAAGDGAEKPACEPVGVDPVQPASPTTDANKNASFAARPITTP
jgi:hypothetical protein